MVADCGPTRVTPVQRTNKSSIFRRLALSKRPCSRTRLIFRIKTSRLSRSCCFRKPETKESVRIAVHKYRAYRVLTLSLGASSETFTVAGEATNHLGGRHSVLCISLKPVGRVQRPSGPWYQVTYVPFLEGSKHHQASAWSLH